MKDSIRPSRSVTADRFYISAVQGLPNGLASAHRSPDLVQNNIPSHTQKPNGKSSTLDGHLGSCVKILILDGVFSGLRPEGLNGVRFSLSPSHDQIANPPAFTGEFSMLQYF